MARCPCISKEDNDLRYPWWDLEEPIRDLRDGVEAVALIADGPNWRNAPEGRALNFISERLRERAEHLHLLFQENALEEV